MALENTRADTVPLAPRGWMVPIRALFLAPAWLAPAGRSRGALAGALAACLLISVGGLADSVDPAGEATIMAGLFLAAAASSIAGFAFSAIAGAMLLHIVGDHVRLVEIMLLCSIANQATMTWAVRRSIAPARLAPFLLGGIIGIPLGVFLLLHAAHATYTQVVGVVLIAYGGYMLFRRPFTLGCPSPCWDIAFGVLGGVTGGAMATPGAPIAMWAATKGWDKLAQRGVTQPFILLMQLLALAAIPVLARGAHETALRPENLMFVPAALLGTACGVALFHRLNDRQFARVMNVLLLISGLGFVV